MTNNESIFEYFRIPDIVSSLNLLSGFIAIIQSINNNFTLASLFLILAIIFDCTDGWVARKLKQDNDSEFGKNMDSLSDAISFGLAPSIFLYQIANQLNPSLKIITLIISAYILWTGVLRLARFNSMKSKIKGFIGVPIPTIAFTLALLYISGLFNIYLAYILTIIISTLMISKIPYNKLNNNTALIIIAILLILTPLQITIYNINIPATLLLILTIIYIIPKKIG